LNRDEEDIVLLSQRRNQRLPLLEDLNLFDGLDWRLYRRDLGVGLA
jgi:hypothetical protein